MTRPAHLLLLALIPGIPWSQVHVDEWAARAPERRPFLYLQTGRQVARLFPGFEGVMAGIYWLRAVQYYGSQRAFAEEKTYELLGPLIEITNALDPRMELAYRYGAIFLAEKWPQGAGRPNEGIRVLERGIRNIPTSWRLRWDLGSLWFFFMHDHKRAAQTFLEAAKVPGAPYWLESLAASVLGRGGYRSVSREIWKRQYENAGEGAIKENALFNLQLLDALDTVDTLNARARRYAETSGRPPSSPRDLVAAGLVAGVPRDPTGVPFHFDPATGHFSIARQSKLWRSTYEE